MKIEFKFMVGYNTSSVRDLIPQHHRRTLIYAKYEGNCNHKEEHKGKNERQSGKKRGEEEKEEPGGVWRL